MALTGIFNFLLPMSVAFDSNCDFFQYMELGQEYFIYNKEYPESYGPGTNCRWVAQSPPNTRIVMSCPDINLPASNNCQADYITISLTGNSSLTDGNRYCGIGTINVVSAENALALGLFSVWYSAGGRFSCSLTAIQSEDGTQSSTTARPNTCDCGWRKKRRIVGGIEAGINEYTYMAAIVEIPYQDVYCGATIISKRYAVTANHCLVDKVATDLGLLVGDHDLSTGTETTHAALYTLEKFVSHPSYNNRTNRNDIAILKTQNVMEFGESVGPVCLPFRYTNRNFIGTSLTVLGWGTTEFSGPKSDVLLATNVSVIPNDECQRALHMNMVFNSQICTYAQGRDACQYDSGGPLIWNVRDTKRDQLLGIISYGLGCASQYPSVNTRVSSFLAWIVSETSGMHIYFCPNSYIINIICFRFHLLHQIRNLFKKNI
ncbi:PREDICTED: venom serine protease-like [Nicrophorus vespilloides]|uniref:Venom serine protease-like n=1 Tax=Nicrophorus vespilloides TaxID=110193 RepID=A0ABM1NB93_NICVS|nr:PREDICTED: venom serine protease-like [Nicrophorus vespilloides]